MVKSSAIALPGYQIAEPLYIGSRTLVYRAVRTDNQQPVVIKLLKNEYPSFSELVQFRNQYTIAKNLDIKGIVKPYSLEPYRNGYALVMEDFGGTSLRHFANEHQLSLEQFFAIALQLVDILLIADTLSCVIDLAVPLTELVYQKTKGNPFFTTQFLKALHQDGYIAYNFTVGHWQCDIAAVKLLSLTDDVVEFMALQLQKLPAETQTMLKLAACIGAQFDLSTLAIVSERSPNSFTIKT